MPQFISGDRVCIVHASGRVHPELLPPGRHIASPPINDGDEGYDQLWHGWEGHTNLTKRAVSLFVDKLHVQHHKEYAIPGYHTQTSDSQTFVGERSGEWREDSKEIRYLLLKLSGVLELDP